MSTNIKQSYQVILYYNFKKVERLEQFCADHRRKCKQLNLLGRVYIAAEGINGTLAGKPQNIEAYKTFLNALPGFSDTEYKEDFCEYLPFTKLIVRLRPEIVALKTSIPLDPIHEKGKYLNSEEWKKALEVEKDYVLIDVRNRYESKIGHFEGAICPDVENFYNFPDWLEQANLPKDKKVMMYCTGGIRCEKFSILMEKKGYKDVVQLHGGIIKYAQEMGGAHYKGKCFVFDDRLAVPIEQNQKEAVSVCEITGVPCDTYINCANLECNKLFICSEEGAKKMQGCCSEACMHVQKKRPFNVDNIYGPTRKWYRYFQNKEDMAKLSKSAMERNA